MGLVLSEPETWIDDDPIGREAGCTSPLHRSGKIGIDLARSVPVVRPDLHGRRSAAHVHQHHGQPQACDGSGALR